MVRGEGRNNIKNTALNIRVTAGSSSPLERTRTKFQDQNGEITVASQPTITVQSDFVLPNVGVDDTARKIVIQDGTAI